MFIKFYKESLSLCQLRALLGLTSKKPWVELSAILETNCAKSDEEEKKDHNIMVLVTKPNLEIKN